MKRYIIKIWENEQARDLGESNIIETNLSNIQEAISKAKRLMTLENYASLEVQNIRENKTFYFSTQNEEKVFEEEIENAEIQEKINKYSKVVYKDELIDNTYEIYGKSKDVIKCLKDNKEYCNSPKAQISEEELEAINTSLDELIKEIEIKYEDEDFVLLSEHPMDGMLNINDNKSLLADLEISYIVEIKDMNLKDINIDDFIEIYFHTNNIRNLMEYGADRDEYVMPSLSTLYGNILDNLKIKYENIITEDISDGKYSTIITFNNDNEISVDTNASNTYKEVSSNIEIIKDNYLKLQKELENTNDISFTENEEDMEM